MCRYDVGFLETLPVTLVDSGAARLTSPVELIQLPRLSCSGLTPTSRGLRDMADGGIQNLLRNGPDKSGIPRMAGTGILILFRSGPDKSGIPRHGRHRNPELVQDGFRQVGDSDLGEMVI